MYRTETDARLAFLKRSALVLSSDSPSTSSHLLATHDRVRSELVKPVSSDQPKAFDASDQQQGYCSSCGTIRIPGVTCTVSTRSRMQKNAKRSRSLSEKVPERRSTIVYGCLRCHRQTFQIFQKEPQHVQKKKTITPSAVAVHQVENSPGIEVSNIAVSKSAGIEGGTTKTSSKKRAKARRNQGLLAALTASKSSQQSSLSNSLGLLDLLQP